jgi:hypothetical protein
VFELLFELPPFSDLESTANPERYRIWSRGRESNPRSRSECYGGEMLIGETQRSRRRE